MYRVQFPPDVESPDQVWYYITFDDEPYTPQNTNLSLNGVWVAVRMNDPSDATQDRFYIEGTGILGRNYPYISGQTMPKDTDPCKGYVPTINDPNDPINDQNNPTTYNPQTVTFPYDRESAVRFAIVQANQNNASAVGTHQVTQAVSAFPSTNFTYSGVNNDTQAVGNTGSSVFISEVLWVGGLPATWSFLDAWNKVSECNDNGLGNYKGWRYCPSDISNGDGSEVWTLHEEIVGYYIANPLHQTGYVTIFTDVDMQINGTRQSLVLIQSDNGTLDYDKMGDLVFDTIENSNDPFFEVQDIQNYFSPSDARLIQGDINEASRSDFYTSWISVVLPSVKSGDYIYINSFDPDIPSDTHGFVVVGWGPLVDCKDAISANFSFSTENNGNGAEYMNTIFPDISTAYGFDSTKNTFGSIPYVVDFSGNRSDGRRQTPKPRPFFCSAYNDPTTVGQENLFSSEHEWYFFRLPDVITLPPTRINSSGQ